MEHTEWYQNNADSPFLYEDEMFENGGGPYIVPVPEYLRYKIIDRPHVESMDQIVNQLQDKAGFTLKLEVLPDSQDLASFWHFEHWQVHGLGELYGVTAYWYHTLSSIEIHYKCCMPRALYELVAPCFTQDIAAGDVNAFAGMLKRLRAAQKAHNRRTRTENLLGASGSGYKWSQRK